MNQDLIQNDTIQQDSMAAGGNGGFNTTTGYVTGATVPSSGTYRASNKYLDTIQIYAAGETFRAFLDGKKCTWYALSPSLSSNSDGSFSSVKVSAGTI
jgi:hypothetical protein